MQNGLVSAETAPARRIRHKPASRMAISIVQGEPMPMPQEGLETNFTNIFAQKEGFKSEMRYIRPWVMATTRSEMIKVSVFLRCGRAYLLTTSIMLSSGEMI